jgi:tetratricopeptide (TPR) repeat protein
MAILPATAAGLLWLTLPINTEVVAWISARSYALCSMFILLCLLSALHYVRSRGWLSGVVCFATAGGAVLSHELGIVILPLLLLLAFAPPRQSSRNWLEMLGAVGLAEGAVAAWRFSLGVKTFSAIATLKWASLAMRQYVVFTLLPLHMSVERSTTLSQGQANRWLFVAIACLALTFGYGALRRKSAPALFIGLTWFAICIAPFCLVMNYQGVAERFAYLASIGMVIAVVAVSSLPPQPMMRRILVVIVLIWGLWNVSRATMRVADWADPVRLYQSSLLANPQSSALHYNLAFSLNQRGDLQEALEEYRRVLQIDRKNAKAYASIGDVYLQLKSFSAAHAAYEKALALHPDDPAVLLNIGAAYQSAGAMGQAETAYQRVLQIDPANSPAHVNLGVLYLKEKRSNDAAHQFAIAIDLKTKDIVPYYDLAVLLEQAGRTDLAVVLYKKILEFKPTDEDTLRNMDRIEQSH